MLPALLPLAHGHGFDDTFAWIAGKRVTLGQWLADVSVLARRLPPAGYAVNLCDNPYAFSLGFAAALIARRTNLLPPARTPDVLSRLGQRYPDTIAFVERAEGELPFEAIVVDPSALSESRGEVPEVPSSQVAALVFTSGTTGEPTPHAKTWRSLVTGARNEVDALAIRGLRVATIVGTVPPQHMYGLESSLLLAWQNGHAFYGSRPFFPADIAAALASVPAPRLLVTTPLHLRALVDSATALPELELIVSATAPLSNALAGAAETCYGVPVREIYGCTETGQIASRRTLDGPLWRLLDGVRLTAKSDVFYACGGHIDEAVALADDLAQNDDATFALRGRKSDVVNIAGKRSSLEYLTKQLLSVRGIEDAAVVMPDERESNTTRLIAFAVAPTLDVTMIIDALRERIDALFLPRPLYLVAELPRRETGKLSREALLDLAARLDREERG